MDESFEMDTSSEFLDEKKAPPREEFKYKSMTVTLDKQPMKKVPENERMIWVVKNVFLWILNLVANEILRGNPITLLAQATGISERQIFNILKAVPARFSAFVKNKPGPPKFNAFSPEDPAAIRNIIYKMVEEGIQPRYKKIYKEFLKLKPDFNCCEKTFKRFISHIGFKFRRGRFNRSAVTESANVKLLRDNFLDRYFKYKEEGRFFYFQDETWIHTADRKVGFWWSDGTPESEMRLKKISKGNRLVIAHLGSREGFLIDDWGNTTSLVMNSKTPFEDYHKNMDHHNFEKWMDEVCLPFMKEDSVLVLDNCPFHKCIENKLPTSAWLKNDIQHYILENGGEYQEKDKKKDLLKICKDMNIDQTPNIYKIMAKKNIKVLFTPPYHCEFNPIEEAWSGVKRRAKEFNINQDENQLINILEVEFRHQHKNWNAYVENAEKKMAARRQMVENSLEVEMDPDDIGLDSLTLDDGSDMSDVEIDTSDVENDNPN